jgi:hypothetical protein
MTQLQTQDTNVAQAVEMALATGDIGRLSPEGRVSYYNAVCKSVGVNPLTRPFEYITLNGKLTLYCRRDATDQLRRVNNVSVAIAKTERIDDVYVVTATARMGERDDMATGVVSIAGLRGEALANALMKAETKAKRRVTLSIVGLGWTDETEIETIPDAVPFSEPNGHDKATVVSPRTRPQASIATVAAAVFPNAQITPPPDERPLKNDWIADEQKRKAFWAQVHELGYKSEGAHKALGVVTMRDWVGSMDDALAILSGGTSSHDSLPPFEAEMDAVGVPA